MATAAPRKIEMIIDAPQPSVVDVEPLTTTTGSKGRLGKLLSPFHGWTREKSRPQASAFPEKTQAQAQASSAGPSEDDRLALLKLVQRLFLPVGLSADGFRSVVFMSPTTGVDATVVADTAEALAAHTRRRICLVDANVRDPLLHRRFAVDNSVGWFDVVTGACTASEAAVSVSATLWLVPAGTRRPDRSVSAEQTSLGVASLLTQFDFVLFAGSSLDTVVDAVQLATHVDGLVLVVDSRARRDDTTNVLERARAGRARVLGAVFHAGTGARRGDL